MLHAMLKKALTAYLHLLSDFPGKWRLLRSVGWAVDGVAVRTRYPGIALNLAVNDRTNQLCVLGQYEATVANAVAALDVGWCFVDVGANCGLFSIMASKRVGRNGLVVAFEPCDTTFAHLKRNLRLNGTRNVIARKCAVSSSAGSARFDTSTAGHTGRYSMATPDADTSVVVACSRIERTDRIGRTIGDRPTMVKIDVEGFEVSALRGMIEIISRPQTRTVIVEVDAANLRRFGESADTLYDILEELGFCAEIGRNHAKHYDEVFTRRSR